MLLTTLSCFDVLLVLLTLNAYALSLSLCNTSSFQIGLRFQLVVYLTQEEDVVGDSYFTPTIEKKEESWLICNRFLIIEAHAAASSIKQLGMWRTLVTA